MIRRIRRIRRDALPEQIRAGLVRGERVLATALDSAGAVVVATDRALWLPAAAGWRRLGWELVDWAGWDADEALLTVVQSGSATRHHVRVQPAALVDVVRERVNAVIVLSRHVVLSGRRGVRVVGRRSPGGQQIHWSAVLDPGLDIANPEVRRRVDAEVAVARAEIGD